jgi:transcriptional pleiotropic repressor
MLETKSLTRRVSGLIQQTEDLDRLLTDVSGALSASVHASVLILDGDGRVAARGVLPEENFLLDCPDALESGHVDGALNERLRSIVESVGNIPMSNLYAADLYANAPTSPYFAGVFPISARTQRIGTMVVYRRGSAFLEEETLRTEMCVMVIALSMGCSISQINAESSRRSKIVKSAIGTLSYSEMEAVLHIFEELSGREGVVIGSKVADKAGITRSVIVNALRKLESAGVIESKSLGMKGTYLKILNDSFLHELQKNKF